MRSSHHCSAVTLRYGAGTSQRMADCSTTYNTYVGPRQLSDNQAPSPSPKTTIAKGQALQRSQLTAILSARVGLVEKV